MVLRGGTSLERDTGQSETRFMVPEMRTHSTKKQMDCAPGNRAVHHWQSCIIWEIAADTSH
jgi:hypothetical protein